MKKELKSQSHLLPVSSYMEETKKETKKETQSDDIIATSSFSLFLKVSASDTKIIFPSSINITSSNILSMSEFRWVDIIILDPSLKLDRIVSKI